jgi:aspartyl protease family protein
MGVLQPLFLALMTTLLLVLSPALQALEIHAQGLLKDAAILLIDGKQQLLKVGQRSPEGVLLLEANAQQALIEYAGERQQLSLSRRISSNYLPAPKASVTIRRNQHNQYISVAKINGKRLEVLVDTGASGVAMSSREAERLDIDYRAGIAAMVRTASGDAPSYTVMLRSVELGGIQVGGVQAFVIEGDYPKIVLLGMSFLQHVNISEENGILQLEGKY